MTTLSWEKYLQLFEQILSGEFTNEMYNKQAYKDYVKMNHSRVHRWLKTGDLNADLVKTMSQIQSKQTWFLIAEPWCGDAAHSTPFIAKMAMLNSNIDLQIVLRDENTDFMDQYLTNGGRSIPKLIARDEKNQDIFVWGPRPQELTQIHLELKQNNEPMDNIHKVLQNWYNQDKGAAIQTELTNLVQNTLLKV